MLIRLKRFCKVALVLCLLAPLTVQAIIPALISLGYIAATTIGSELSVALGISTIAIGTAIGWLTFGADPVTDSTKAPLRVQLDVRTPPVTPTGWSRPGGGGTPVPPATEPQAQYWVAQGTLANGTFPSHSASAASYCGAFSPATGGSPTLTSQTAASAFYSCVQNGNPTQNFATYMYTGCPNGYTQSGANCNMTNVAAVMKPTDGKVDVKRNNLAFNKDSNDGADFAGASNVVITNDKVEIADTGGTQAGTRVMTDQTTGVVTVVEEKRDPTTGFISHETMTVAPAIAGGNTGMTVTGHSGGVGRGPGAPVSSGGQGSGGAPTGSTGAACGAPGQPSCSVTVTNPSTGGQAVCGASPLPACEVNFGEPTDGPVDPTSKTSEEITAVLELPSLSGFKTFKIANHISVCPTPSFSAFGVVHSFESHCGLLDPHTAALRAVMSLVFGISAVFIVLRA